MRWSKKALPQECARGFSMSLPQLYFLSSRLQPCSGWPEIHIRLTLYVMQCGPVILGGAGYGINSFKTILVRKEISKAIVGNSLHPLAIILLHNAPLHCHWWPDIHIRLTLYVVQDGPVKLGGEGCGNNSFKTMLVRKEISKAIVGFSPSTGHHIAA